MSNYRIYEGKDIFTLSENKQEAIVEGLLYENDCIMLVAAPKMSKTVFAMQLACNISSGTPFLNLLEIPKASKVLYIATEMKDEELKDRFIRTTNYIEANHNNLILLCTKGTSFKFNTTSGKVSLNEIIEKYRKEPPKVIFIDSVYKAFYGSLTKDDIVNDFLMEVDRLAGAFDAAIVLVHHSKKASRDRDNNEFELNDADTYGSQFLIAAADHVVRLEKIYKEDAPLDRYVRCETQRGGNIISDIRIRLNEPDPLYFHIIGNNETEKKDILHLMMKENKQMSINELIKKGNLGRTKMYQVLKELQDEGLILKSGGRQKFYNIKNGG